MAFVYRFFAFFAAHLPLVLVLMGGRFSGWLLGTLFRYHRRGAKKALQRSFPDKDRRWIRSVLRRSYGNLGITIAELLRVLGGSSSQLEKMVEVDPADLKKIDNALAKGKGVIILTAHFGSWNLLAFKTPMMGYLLDIVARPLKNPALKQLVEQVRKKIGLGVLGSKNSYRNCLTSLKKNRILGFMHDLNMWGKREVLVPFFNRPVSSSTSLAHMAARSGAVVIPAFIYRLGKGRHKVKIGEAFTPPLSRNKEHLLEKIKEYTAVIEVAVRSAPEQWIWVYPRWRKKP